MKNVDVRKEFEVFRRLFALSGGHLWFLPAMILLGLLTAVFEGFSLVLVVPLVQTLGGGDAPSDQGQLLQILHGLMAQAPVESRLLAIILAIFCAVLLKCVVDYANMVVLVIVYGRLSHSLRTGLFARIIAMPLSRVERERSGRLLNVMDTETWRTTDALNTLFAMITSLSTLLVFAGLLLVLSWRLTLLALLCLAVIPPLVRLLTRRLKGLSETGLAANQILARRTWSTLNGLRIIRAFGREGFEVERFTGTSDRVRDTFLRMALISMTTRPIAEVTITGIIALLALLFDPTHIAVPTLVGFLAILYRLQPRVMALVSSQAQLLSLYASVVEVSDMIASPPDKKQIVPPGKTFPGLLHELRFVQVTYAYGEVDRPALNNVSFTIPRGAVVAIIGPSGAGKSTVLDLLLGFLDPQCGEIRVDDQPLRKIDQGSWRAHIGVVGQDPYIFDDSVRANIRYGRPDASDADIVEAARLACIDQFIDELPQGYDTIVGDRGTQISGGQRQRLALARALVRQPDILVLDEATNALDIETERAVQETLRRFSGERTVIIVSHRLTMIDMVDQVIVLDRGRVVEDGAPEALLATDGFLTRLRRLHEVSPVSS